MKSLSRPTSLVLSSTTALFGVVVSLSLATFGYLVAAQVVAVVVFALAYAMRSHAGVALLFAVGVLATALVVAGNVAGAALTVGYALTLGYFLFRHQAATH